MGPRDATPEPPASTARLFAPDPEVALDPSRSGALVIGRLLEDGDSEDLRWLAAAVGEARMADWLERRGGRQLSRRSRLFWERLLGRAAAAPERGAGELWPL